jgi:hypothetical protein
MYKYIFLATFCLGLFVSCHNNEQHQVKIDRFYSELYYLLVHPSDSLSESRFMKKYADFLPLYIGGVLKLHVDEDQFAMISMRKFFKDSTLMKLYADEQAKFKDVSNAETALSEAMNRFHDWFPKDTLPTFRLHVSGLTQSVVTSGRLVSIAGDKYLGQNYGMYKPYFYDYQLRFMQTENVANDALKAFLQSRFPEPASEELIDRMIYKGVILAAISELNPDLSAAQNLGYTTEELGWLMKAEKEIWMYMVENEHIYATDPLVVSKYMEEAPFTSYFGNKSPARIGVFIGYEIAKAYLTKQNTPLPKLLVYIDAKKILMESGYRP